MFPLDALHLKHNERPGETALHEDLNRGSIFPNSTALMIRQVQHCRFVTRCLAGATGNALWIDKTWEKLPV